MDNLTLTSWIALSIGFVHALEPGHGKTALFAYLASGKKTWKEGLVISLSSALTHSLAVFFIAFISHLLLHQAVNESNIHSLTHYLNYASGAIIISLGLWVINKARRGEDLHANCCGHHHEHDQDTKHQSVIDIHSGEQKIQFHQVQNAQFKFQGSSKPLPKKPSSKSGLLASGLIGVATGIIPCPTVIVAYLGGVSTGNSYLGIQSVAYFAFGMFLALLSLVMLFNFGGQKVISKIKSNKISNMNWGYLQGGIFIVVGIVTAVMH